MDSKELVITSDHLRSEKDAIVKQTNSVAVTTHFTEVGQDCAGTIVASGGLYTCNLMNCVCLIFEGRDKKFAMLHVSPGHKSLEKWVTSVCTQIEPTEVVVAGANSPFQATDRSETLLRLLAEVNKIVDETKAGWLGTADKVTRGTNSSMVGYVILSATTGEYSLHGAAPSNLTTATTPVTGGRGRGGSDGCCIIM